MNSAMKNLNELWDIFFVFIFQPEKYVLKTSNISEPKDRFLYLTRFLVFPCIGLTVITLFAALMCSLMHIRYSPLTTLINVSVGLIAGILSCLFVGTRFSIAQGMLFGMSTGIVFGYPFAIWMTIPLPDNYILPNIHNFYVSTHYINGEKRLLFDPWRDVIIMLVTGFLGGLYFKTIDTILGKPTEGVRFALFLGLFNGISIMIFVDPLIGLICVGLVSFLLYAGFANRKNKLFGSILFSLAFSIAFALPIWKSYSYAPQPFYDPNSWSIKIGLATFVSFWFTYQRFILFPLQAFFTSWLYLRAIKTGNVLEYWRKVPVIHDETIQIPLPYITEFLVLLASKDKAVAHEELLFIIEYRHSHLDVAQDALFKILPDDLSIESIDDIISVPDKIQWLREIAAKYTLLFPIWSSFNKIALHVIEFKRLHPVYTYKELENISRAIQESENMQSSIRIQNVSEHKTFIPLLEKWVKVMKEEKEKYDDIKYENIPQLFMTGNPIQSRSHMFIGRDDIFSKIESGCLNMSQSPAILFYGARRMGKTSVLNQLSTRLDSKIIPVRIDCQDARLIISLHTHLYAICTSVADSLKGCGYACKVPEITLFETNKAYDTLNSWMKAQFKMLRGKKILLCIDEYEALNSLIKTEWGISLLKNYRYMMQNTNDYSNLIFLFTGAKPFDRLGKDWNDIFINVQPIKLTDLTHRESQNLLCLPYEYGMKYQDESKCISEILKATHRQPYLLQAIGWNIIDILNESRRTLATLEDCQLAIGKVVEETGRPYFVNLWLESGNEGQDVLRAIIQNRAVPDYPSAKNRLLEDGILFKNELFIIPMFERWLRDNIHNL